jgi:hypothetical protein
MQLSLKHHLKFLLSDLEHSLKSASELAEGGKKDEARQIVNRLENSWVIELVGHPEFGVVSAVERNRLQKQLVKVRGECHPLDVANYQSDFAAIRGEISRITKHLGLDAVSKFSAELDEKIIQFPGANRPASGCS